MAHIIQIDLLMFYMKYLPLLTVDYVLTVFLVNPKNQIKIIEDKEIHKSEMYALFHYLNRKK